VNRLRLPMGAEMRGVRSNWGLAPLFCLGFVVLGCGRTPAAVTQGGSSVATPDLGTPDGIAVGELCDVWAQDCQTTLKCVPVADEAGAVGFSEHRCVVVLAGADLYEPCKSYGLVVGNFDNCAHGQICWGESGGHPHPGQAIGQGRCVGICGGTEESPQCQDEYAICRSASGGVVHLCAAQCNPFTLDCGTERACLWDEASRRFSCGLPAYKIIEHGDDCLGCEHCCALGLYCAEGGKVPGCGGESCCNAWCDISAPSACVEGQQCKKFWREGETPPGHELLGQCQLD